MGRFSRRLGPPFYANQIGTNETLQREENNVGYGMPVLWHFELAYEYDAVTYAPKDKVREWEILIQFEITGLSARGNIDLGIYRSLAVALMKRRGGHRTGRDQCCQIGFGDIRSSRRWKTFGFGADAQGRYGSVRA